MSTTCAVLLLTSNDTFSQRKLAFFLCSWYCLCFHDWQIDFANYLLLHTCIHTYIHFELDSRTRVGRGASCQFAGYISEALRDHVLTCFKVQISLGNNSTLIPKLESTLPSFLPSFLFFDFAKFYLGSILMAPKNNLSTFARTQGGHSVITQIKLMVWSD